VTETPPAGIGKTQEKQSQKRRYVPLMKEEDKSGDCKGEETEERSKEVGSRKTGSRAAEKNT
jgi:hypothetical protein